MPVTKGNRIEGIISMPTMVIASARIQLLSAGNSDSQLSIRGFGDDVRNRAWYVRLRTRASLRSSFPELPALTLLVGPNADKLLDAFGTLRVLKLLLVNLLAALLVRSVA